MTSLADDIAAAALPGGITALRAFTDGACTGNGKVNALSGCGVWFGSDNDPRNLSVILPRPPHTNQRAELFAVVLALQTAVVTHTEAPLDRVEIVSDSMYCVKGAGCWMKSWQASGWCKSDGKPVANIDLWQMVWLHTQGLADRGVHVVYTWTKAHAGNAGNEAADRLAGLSIKEHTPEK